MLVSKNKATNSLLKSEKQTLIRFLALYIAIILLIITIVAAYYYQTQEKLRLSHERSILYKYAYVQTKRLKALHQFFDKQTTYPRDPRFKSAIYDIEGKEIFSLLENKHIHFDEEIYFDHGYFHFIKSLDEFYLGTKYLIIEIKDDGKWIIKIWKNIIIFGFLFLLFFSLFGIYLTKLFLKPMHNSIVLLDRFIKDTTHELNTPLSAILANVEMMDTDAMLDKNKSKLNRINIAAKTVSILYKDLTYLTLEQEKPNENEEINLKVLIENRAEYFSILAESKKINYEFDMQNVKLYIDKHKFTRVIDNLISNAIKYNKRNGTVGFQLTEHSLTVWDTGIGIEKDKIALVFDRYSRFNQSEGGFGIGLSIVKRIVEDCSMHIKVDSTKDKGTRITLLW